MDDRELVDRYRAGETEALGLLYDRHAPGIYRFLRGMVGPHDGEDALQETFIKAGRNLSRYEHRGNLPGWLLSIARTVALDRLRRRKRRDEQALAEDASAGLADPGPAPDEKGARNELGQRIRQAVRELPENQQQVFLLREENGLAFREIAEMLKMPLGTALSHMHRATANLRAALADLKESVE